MKFAITYDRTIPFRHTKEVDEIVFEYAYHKNEILKVISEGQVAIIQIGDISFEEFQALTPELIDLNKKLNNNLVIMLSFFTQKSFIDTCNEIQIKFMFSTYAKDKETVYAMAKLGAYSIYIVEGLCFNCKSLQYIRQKFGSELRVYPDVAASAKGTADCIPSLQKFFIRPEDIWIYDEYIDTCEFWCKTDRLSVIYEIYTQQQWLGRLGDVIVGLDIDIDNKTIVPHFGQMRVDCNKKCLNGQCFLCEEMEKLAAKFEEAGLEIVQKRKKKERTDEEIEEGINKLKERGEQLKNNESATNEKTMLPE